MDGVKGKVVTLPDGRRVFLPQGGSGTSPPRPELVAAGEARAAAVARQEALCAAAIDDAVSRGELACRVSVPVFEGVCDKLRRCGYVVSVVGVEGGGYATTIDWSRG